MTAAAAGAGPQRPWPLPGLRGGAGSRRRAGRLRRWLLSPAPRPRLHPSRGGAARAGPAGRSAGPRTSAAPAGGALSVSPSRSACRFGLRVHHRAPSPPPRPCAPASSPAPAAHLDRDQRPARAAEAPRGGRASRVAALRGTGPRRRPLTAPARLGHGRPKAPAAGASNGSGECAGRELGHGERTPRRRRRRSGRGRGGPCQVVLRKKEVRMTARATPSVPRSPSSPARSARAASRAGTCSGTDRRAINNALQGKSAFRFHAATLQPGRIRAGA